MRTRSSIKPLASRSAYAAEAIPQFQEGISLVFSQWWGLQMAVENGGEPIYIDDLENLLVEGMDAFHTDVYDGSIEEVAEHLMIMHEECLGGDYQSIQKLKQVKPVSGTLVRKDPNDSDDDDEEDEDDESIENDKASNMMVDLSGSLPNTNASQTSKNSIHQQMTEAEDGWTVVPSRKSKGRKH
ncbi:hypothetical protein BVRB_3g062620 isoform B [Beta vulgaris subsp. vulgaris]|nr:hypothetical protein BVRB_3g062620 isoform B [Beta vulgaris subsp. vulgaris]